jgi:hypothetical protein
MWENGLVQKKPKVLGQDLMLVLEFYIVQPFISVAISLESTNKRLKVWEPQVERRTVIPSEKSPRMESVRFCLAWRWPAMLGSILPLTHSPPLPCSPVPLVAHGCT